MHWTMASSFVVLAPGGLNMVIGRHIMQPWLGEEAFGAATHWGKLAHNWAPRGQFLDKAHDKLVLPELLRPVIAKTLIVRSRLVRRHALPYLTRRLQIGGGVDVEERIVRDGGKFRQRIAVPVGPDDHLGHPVLQRRPQIVAQGHRPKAKGRLADQSPALARGGQHDGLSVGAGRRAARPDRAAQRACRPLRSAHD